MKIDIRQIDSIRPYENNPRQNDQAVDAVAASLREFGWKQPIVVDADGVIVCGHTRYKAAQKLGLDKVPVHVATDLSPEQVRAYRISDNKTADLSDWDFEILPIEIAALQDAGFDLDVLAFDDKELANLPAGDLNQGLTDPDEVPQPPDEPVTRRGDLWILGDHRLLCGDSGSAENVDRLLDGTTAQLVVTDPPYNVRLEPRSNNAIAAGLSSFQGTKHHQKFDVERHPEKAQGMHRKMRAKDRQLRQLSTILEEECFAFFAGDNLGEGASRLDPQGFPRKSRVVLLWLEGRCSPPVLRPQQRPGRVVGEEDQPPANGAHYPEARGTGRPRH